MRGVLIDSPQSVRNTARTLLFLTALLIIPLGCNPAAPTPTIAKPVAPVTPVAVKSQSLPNVKFVEVTAASGIKFVHTNGARGEKLLPETMGAGVAFLDYDGDGDQDLFFVNSAHWPAENGEPAPADKPTQALYRNDGKGRFEDVTAAAGLEQTFYGMGVAVGDYDNDGDPDLYITTLSGGRLFRNDRGRFTDVTDAAGARGSDGWQTSAAFFDVENDGDLDLFICQYVAWSAEYDRGQDFQLTGTGHGRAYGPPTAFPGSFCILLRNDSGKFVDVSAEAGIRVRSPSGDPVAKALGVSPFDVDGDGLVDIAVSNDTVQNFLFHNLGNGKFEEEGIPAGIAYDQSGTPRAGMGLSWAHFLNDDSLALAVGNFANEMTALYVCDEPKSRQFSDLANIHGLGAPTQPPLKFGMFFFDYDLDGRQDLLTTNGHLETDIAKVQASQSYAQPAQLFWNSGRRGRSLFVLVGADAAGRDLFRPIVGRGSAYADIDGDGDLDVVLTANNGPPHLYRNEGGNRNHWLRLVLKGTTSNRDALGARVTVEVAGITQRRQLFPAVGYMSSVELPLTFGLGKAAKADRVTVIWPSGEKTERTDVPGDATVVLEEPTVK